MTIYGWDVSDFDWARGPMNIAAARAAGVDFLTHKATEAISTKHFHYGTILTRARDAGIPVLGAYIVPRTPSSSHGSVAQQVSYFLDFVTAQTPWWKTWPHWMWQVDLERWAYDQVQPEVGVATCKELALRTGRRVVLYAPRWAYGDTIPGNDPLWSSDFGTNPTTDFKTAYARRGGDTGTGWNRYSGRTPAIWQYGSNTIIGGQPNCDANAWRGTLDQLKALTSMGTPGSETDVTTPLTSKQTSDAVWINHLVIDNVNMYDNFVFLKRGIQQLLARPLMTDEQLAELIKAIIDAPDNPLSEADMAAVVAVAEGVLAAQAEKVRAEIRDAVADLGEGGADKVRADAEE